MTSSEPAPKVKPVKPWLTEWLPVLVGLIALYLQPFYSLATGIWQEDDYAHGPIILGVLIWLIWDKRRVLLYSPERSRQGLLGLAVVIFGLLIYVLGRSQNITVLTIGSLIPIIGGTLLTLRGATGMRSFWFILLFTLYLIPLPGAFVDGVTGVLKHHVSEIAEEVLYHAGYPIARNGVALTIGPYQLLVADACSGINSMFSLSAIGMLYLYVMHRHNWLHIAVILTSLLPVAFFANVVRVILLVLLTYHFGDATGQGFLHAFSGMVLFVVALLTIVSIDRISNRVIECADTIR